MGDFFSDLTDIVTQPLGLSENEASKAARRGARALGELSLPELKDLESRGLTEGELLSGTAFDTMDPTGRNAQLQALGKLQQLSEGGLTDADRARLQEIARDEAIRERGQRESIAQDFQRRGVGGGDAELVQKLLAQQAGADRASARDLGVEQLAEQRALDALARSGSLGGQIRAGDAERASAQDVINRFNAVRRQQIADENQRIREINQLDLPQRRYQNEFSRLTGQNALNMQSAQARDAQRSTAFNTIANAATAAATGGAVPPGGSNFFAPKTQNTGNEDFNFNLTYK